MGIGKSPDKRARIKFDDARPVCIKTSDHLKDKRMPLANSRKIFLSIAAAFFAVAQPNLAVSGTNRGLTEPENTVRAFYDLMANGRCDAAANFRTGYTQERCGAVSEVKIGHLEQHYKDNATAVVDLELSYRRTGQTAPTYFQGYLTLHYIGDRWVIDGGSYRSRNMLELSRYLRTVARVEPSALIDETTMAKRLRVSRLARPSASEPIEPVSAEPDKPILVRPSTRQVPALPTFGSDVVLTTLWSAEQLSGTAGDRRITSLKRPDREPPARMVPHTLLAPLAKERRRSIRRVEPYDGKKIVALTFDLCERADDVTGYDPDVVQVLRTHEAAATFFAGGKWMRSHPDKTMQLMADPLFEVGNHAWTHANFRRVNDGKVEEQILWTQAQYELLREHLSEWAVAKGVDDKEIARIPPAPQTFRFPYGTCNASALERVASYGLPSIQWDVVSGDPDPSVKADDLARRVLKSVRPGSIVVFHANGRGWRTANALPTILQRLKTDGYRFVTVTELLDSGVPIAADDCYEVQPGDNSRYDTLFGDGTG